MATAAAMGTSLPPEVMEGLRGSRGKHSFSWRHGNAHASLHYSVEHNDEAIDLNAVDGILGVRCTDDWLALSMDSRASAMKFVNSMQFMQLLSSTRWVCNGQHVMRRAIADAVIMNLDNVVNVTTEEAYHHDFLRSADVIFKTNLLGSQPLHPRPENSKRVARRGRWSSEHSRQLGHSVLASMWSGVGFIGGIIARKLSEDAFALAGEVSHALTQLAELLNISSPLITAFDEFVSQGTINHGEQMTYTHQIGSWSYNYAGGLSVPATPVHGETSNTRSSWWPFGRRLAAISCLQCASPEPTIPSCPMIQTRASTHCPPTAGEITLSLTTGGSCAYTYESASSGTPRVARATCAIRAADVGNARSDTTPSTKQYTCALGACSCDNAGHILSSELGGCGDCHVNIFPQNAQMNQHGQWRRFEASIRRCVSNPAVGEAQLGWSFSYASMDDTRPIAVTYNVDYPNSISPTDYPECTSRSQCFANACNGHDESLGPDPALSACNTAAQPLDLTEEGSAEAGIRCSNCYAVATADLVFTYRVADWTVQKFDVTVEGNALLKLEAEAYAHGFYERSPPPTELISFNIPNPAITFAIGGLPVTLDFLLTAKAGYEFNANAKLSLQFGAQMNGKLAFGFSYERQRPGGSDFKTVARADWESRSDDLQIDGSATAYFQAYIMPIVMVRVYKMGGPTLSIKGYLEAVFDASASSTVDASGLAVNEGCMAASTSVGAHLNIGAKIDFKNPITGHQLCSDCSIATPDLTVASPKWPLASGRVCASGRSDLSSMVQGLSNRSSLQQSALPPAPVGLSVSRRLSSPSSVPAIERMSGFSPGTTWTGRLTRIKQTADCDMYPDYVLLSMMVVQYTADGSGATIDVLVSINQASLSDMFAAETQQIWTATYRELASGGFDINPIDTVPNRQKAAFNASLFSKSTYGAMAWSSLRWYAFGVTPDSDNITLQDSLLCSSFVLSRSSSSGTRTPPCMARRLYNESATSIGSHGRRLATSCFPPQFTVQPQASGQGETNFEIRLTLADAVGSMTAIAAILICCCAWLCYCMKRKTQSPSTTNTISSFTTELTSAGQSGESRLSQDGVLRVGTASDHVRLRPMGSFESDRSEVSPQHTARVWLDSQIHDAETQDGDENATMERGYGFQHTTAKASARI